MGVMAFVVATKKRERRERSFMLLVLVLKDVVNVCWQMQMNNSNNYDVKNEEQTNSNRRFFQGKSLASSGSNYRFYRLQLPSLIFFSKKVSSLTPSCCRCQTGRVMSAKNQSIHQQNSNNAYEKRAKIALAGLLARWPIISHTYFVRTLLKRESMRLPSMSLCGTWIVSLFVSLSQSSLKTDWFSKWSLWAMLLEENDEDSYKT